MENQNIKKSDDSIIRRIYTSIITFVKIRIYRSVQSFRSQMLWAGILCFIVFFAAFILFKYIIKVDVLSDSEILGLFLDPGSFMNYIGSEGNNNDGRISAFLITLAGVVFFTGVMITIFGGILSRLSEKKRTGQVFYKFRNHTVILGYDETVPSIIENIISNNNKQNILLQSTRETDGLIQLLRTKLTDYNIFKQVFIVHAQRDSKEDLIKMRIQHADEIYIIGETDEAEHDSRNLNTWKIICGLVKKPITVRVALYNQSTFALFQRYNPNKNHDSDSPLFRPYNFDQMWANRVTTPELFGEKRHILDYEPITKDSEKHVHLVICGMNNLGIALGIEAAQIAHYPNFITKKKRTKITFIAEDAYTEMCYLTGRYKELFKLSNYTFTQIDNGIINEKTSIKHPSENDFLDIEWEFIQANIAEPLIQKMIQYWSCDNNQLLSFAFCGDSASRNLAAGLYLPREVYENNIPILVEQHEFDKKQIDIPAYSNIRYFGMYNNIDFDSALPLAMETDRNYNEKHNYSTNWEKLPPSKKWSNIYSGCSIFTKLHSLELDWKTIDKNAISDNNTIEMMAKVEHNRWNVEELLFGYRPTNDAENEEIAFKHEKKTNDRPKDVYKKRFIHYDIRPFDDLKNDDDGIDVKINDIENIQSICEVIEKYKSN